MIHIVKVSFDQKATEHQIITHDSIKKTDSELLKAFPKKNKIAEGNVFAPIDDKLNINEITYLPWESVALRN